MSEAGRRAPASLSPCLGIVPGGATFLAALGAIARRLVCGGDAAPWLVEMGLPVPALCTWAGFGRAGCVARLGPREWLVSADGTTPLPAPLVAGPGARAAVLALDHECAEFALGGAGVPTLFAELVATDLGQFAAQAFVPVLLAGAECWLRALPAPRPHWRIVCAPAEASFVFGTLQALVREAGGEPIGRDDFLSVQFNEEVRS